MLALIVASALLGLAVWRLCRVFREHARLMRDTAHIYCITQTLPFIGQGHLFPRDSFTWITWMQHSATECRRLGHNLMRWWCANKLVVVTLDGEAAKVILENTSLLKKGPDYEFFYQWLGNGILASDGEQWRRQRRFFTPILHFAMLEQYTPTFNKYGRKLVDQLAAMEGARELTDVSPLMVQCALYNVTEPVMGVELDLDQELCHYYMGTLEKFNLYQHIYGLCPLYIACPWAWYLFGHGFATRRCVRALKAFSMRVVEDRIRIREQQQQHKTAKASNGSTSNGTSNGISNGKCGATNGTTPIANYKEKKRVAFLDFLLSLEGDDKLSKEEIRQQVDGFMFGGHDTVAHALMWFLWSMACHPEYQQRVRGEIVEQFGTYSSEEEESQNPLELATADVANLPFLEQCLKETLRMFPIVPVMERQLEQDVCIGGKTLLRGTVVGIPPFLIHHNEKVYPQHWEFDPDNFLPERVAKRSMYDFIPFSAGPRNCVGQKFAMLELKIILVHMFRRLRFSTTIPFERNRPAMEAVSRLELGTPLQIHLA